MVNSHKQANNEKAIGVDDIREQMLHMAGYAYYYIAFIKRHTSGLKTCSEALTRHSV